MSDFLATLTNTLRGNVTGAADRFTTPGELAKFIDARTIATPALELIDEALVAAITTPDKRLIITMPPQEGKSTRVARDFPVWALLRNPDMRIICGSYGQPLANRNGREIRKIITSIPDLPLSITKDHGQINEWTIDGFRGGVRSVGVGAGVTGHSADLVIIDDPVKNWQDAYSAVKRDTVWNWWKSDINTRLAPGAPAIVILTRWHHDDLAGRLLDIEDTPWEVLNIPARCVDPETDILGREYGEYMKSARSRSREQWEMREKEAGPTAWAALYQGNPSPDTGTIFSPDSWARYTEALWTQRSDGSMFVPGLDHADCEIVQSWDLAFKGSKTSDFVVGQVWLRRGVHAYLLDQIRGRMTFVETCAAIRNMTAKWPQAIAKLIEDAANGPAVMNALAHEVGGMIPVKPEGSKVSRAHAVSPLVESRNVWLPDEKLCPWITDFISEAAVFPAGAHDDQVDPMTQAIHRLLLMHVVDTSAEAYHIDDYDMFKLEWGEDYDL